jgi:hypothetical protein
MVEGSPVTPEIARFISHFAWQGKILDAKAGLLKNMISPLGIAAIVARYIRRKAGLTARSALCSTIQRRQSLRDGSETRSG